MVAVERKVEQFRQKLIRINNIKKQLIDCEMSWIKIVEALNLSQYEYRKLMAGDLEEREAEVMALIEKTPEYIKKRDKVAKSFQKILLDKEITVKEFCKKNKLDVNRLYRVLRGLDAERDIKTEKAIEKALDTKIF